MPVMPPSQRVKVELEYEHRRREAAEALLVAERKRAEEAERRVPKIVRRRTRVEFPGLCRVRQPAKLEVQLTVAEPTRSVVRDNVDVPLPAPAESAKLLVVVHAPGFEVSPESSQPIQVPPYGDSTVAEFLLTPSQGRQTGST